MKKIFLAVYTNQLFYFKHSRQYVIKSLTKSTLEWELYIIQINFHTSIFKSATALVSKWLQNASFQKSTDSVGQNWFDQQHPHLRLEIYIKIYIKCRKTSIMLVSVRQEEINSKIASY